MNNVLARMNTVTDIINQLNNRSCNDLSGFDSVIELSGDHCVLSQLAIGDH